MSTPMKYKVRPGTIDSGKPYEIRIIALLSLKCCLRDIEHFWIASNVGECGDFDDIVLFTKEKNKKGTTYLIQLKHQDDPREITRKEILGAKGKKYRDFSLTKYLDSCLKLSKEISKTSSEKCDIIEHLKKNPEMVFVLFTNRNVGLELEFLEKIRSCGNLINISGNIYGFNSEKLNIFSTSNDTREQFIKKMFLYAKQPHIREIDNEIKKLLGTLIKYISKLDKDLDVIVKKFLLFVEEWSKGLLDEHYPLGKPLILRKITEILLEPFVVQLKEQILIPEEEAKYSLWNKMIKNKNLIVINSSDEIVDQFMETFVCGFVAKHKELVQSSLSIKKDLMRIPGKKYLNSLSEFYEYLWKIKEIPLIIQVNSQSEIDEIGGILKISKDIFRIIILNKTKISLDFLQSSSKTLLTVSDLSSKHQKHLYSLPIKLQGRDFPGWEKLNLDVKEIFEFKTKDIIYILCNRFNIGQEFEELPRVFVNISLKRVWLDSQVLEKSIEDAFIIQCGSKENLKKLNNADLQVTEWNNNDNFDFDQHRIILCEKVDSKNDFDSSDRSIHFLRFHDNFKFEWIKSWGIIKNLRDFRISKETKEKGILANDIIADFCIDRKPIIVSSNPGMGKSVFVNYFARNTPTDYWILKLNLAKYYKHFITTSECTFNLKSFFEQILQEGSTENLSLIKAVFAKFYESKNIVILLDGFDEIPINYQKYAKQFIKFASKSGYFVLITTRPVFKNDLEILLDIFSLDLNLFTRKSQQYFLQKYFLKFSKISCVADISSLFTQSLLKAARNNLNDPNNEFTGVPLQTLLLAEVFIEDFQKFIKTKSFINKHFDLLYLYRNFIEKKIKIACEKFGDISEDVKHHYKVCKSFYALRLLFSEEDLEELQIDLKLEHGKSLFPHMLELLQKDGIVVAETETSVGFVHQTFAEYLAAEWIAENIKGKNEKIAKRLLKATFDPNLKVVRSIFDRILAKDCPLHLAIINFQMDKVNNLIKSEHFEDVDDGNRNCLHLLASWGFYHPAEWQDRYSYIKKMSTEDKIVGVLNLIPGDKLKNSRDHILDFTPIDYAIISSSLHIANMLCSRMKDSLIQINVENLKVPSLLDYRDYARYFSLERAVINHKSIDFRLFIDENNSFSYKISKGDTKNLNELLLDATTQVNKRDKFGLTPLHVAVRSEIEEVVEILLHSGADTNLADSTGKTPLHWSVILGNLNMVKLLIANGADLNIVDNRKRTALHYGVLACPQHQIEIVSQLLNTDVDIMDESKRTPFLWAAYFGYTECVKLFLEMDVVPTEQRNEALYCAAHNEHIDTVDLLLSKGANVNVNCNGVTPLIDSVIYGNINVLCYLLNLGIDIDTRICDGIPTLCWAAGAGHKDIVELLLSRGLDIESKDEEGKSSLHFAALCGREDIVEFLLSKRTNINAKDNYANSALYYAIEEGHKEIVTLLLSKGSKIPDTSLHISASRGHTDLINLLLSKHIDINLRDKEGATALHYAAENGRKDFACLILKKGAYLEARNYRYETPLILAVRQGQMEVTNMLLAEGANMETRTLNDETPLIVSVKNGQNEITKLLITKGSKIKVRDNEGKTAFHWAVSNPDSTLETIELFLSKSPDLLQLRTIKQETPLISATQGGSRTILKFLLSMDVDIEAKDQDGMTALHWASFKGYKDIVGLLLQNNADLEEKDSEGKTALMDAALNGHKGVVSILLSNKADSDVKDKHGLTALQWAKRYDHEDVMELLKLDRL